MNWDDLLKPGGLTVTMLLLFFIYGQTRGWWVSGREYDRLKDEVEAKDAEIERWQTIAMDGFGLADQASRQAVRAVRVGVRRDRVRRPRSTEEPDG